MVAAETAKLHPDCVAVHVCEYESVCEDFQVVQVMVVPSKCCSVAAGLVYKF